MNSRRDFRADPEWVADRLIPNITPLQAARALDTLVELGLLVKDETGRLVQADSLLSTGPETRGLHLALAPNLSIQSRAEFAKLATLPTGDALKNVLLYHVVAGAVGSGDLVAGPVPTLLTGKSVTVSLTGGVKINDSKVTTANVLAKNGVIHVVDTVLVPE